MLDANLQSRLALKRANTTAFSTLRGLGQSKSSTSATSAFALAEVFEFCHRTCHGAETPRAYLWLSSEKQESDA
jgi:hypothetical protein